jgi:hypothetical protein
MISLRTRWTRILAHIAPSQLPASATWRNSAIMRNSLKDRIERHLFEAIENFAGEAAFLTFPPD